MAGTTIVVKDVNSRKYIFLYKENRLKNVTAISACQKKGNTILVAAGESSTGEDVPATVKI